jgi:glycosyltransferase involved in cell wall biosynthesis
VAVQEAERRWKTGAFRCLVTFAQPWSDHLIGLRVHRDLGVPWLAHFSDPWVDSPYLPKKARALAQRFEADVVNGADVLVFVTQQTVDGVMAKYPAALRAKAHVVPHAFDRSVAPQTTTRDGARGRLKLVYTGRFYDDIRTPNALFSALARLAPIPTPELVLMGPNMRRYRSVAHRYGIADAVVLSDAVPYETALREAASADVLVAIDAEAEGASMFLPSKLVDYLMLRKPILGLTPPGGASAELLHRLGFKTAAPNDADAIEALLRELLDARKRGMLDVPPQFDVVAAEYDIERTSTAFAVLLDRWH